MVEAFSKMTDKKLKVVGQGSEFKNIKNNVTPNIELLGYKNDKELKTLLQKARAFVFAAEEDFGITVVEAMACGTPVIALNKGGTAETVIDSKTGILFNSQNVKSIKGAVLQFEDKAGIFNPQIISDHARQFNREIFEGKIKEYVREKSLNFFNKEVIH